MNLLDFAVTPLWLVWETVRDVAAEDGVELAESELIGLAPLAAFLAVADHAGAPPDAPVERRLAAAAAYLRLRDFSPMQALELRLEAARSRPARAGERRPVPRHQGRAKRGTDARVCSWSGPARSSRWPAASRAGAARARWRRVGRRRRRTRRPDAPVVACWEGRIVAVGAAGGASRRRSRPRAIRSAGSPGSTPAAARSRRASWTRTRTCSSRASREGELLLRQRGAGYLEILAAGGGILSTVAATRAASAAALLAHGRRWLDEMLGHGVTTIEAKSGYGLDLETEIRLLDVAYRLGREGPIDVVPTFLGAHAVPPEFRAGPTATEAYVRSVIEEQLPGVAAQGRARFCDVFCEDGRVQRGPVAADPDGRGRVRHATAAPRRRARAVGWRGAGGRARGGVCGPPRDAVGSGHRCAGRGGR